MRGSRHTGKEGNGVELVKLKEEKIRNLGKTRAKVAACKKKRRKWVVVRVAWCECDASI